MPSSGNFSTMNPLHKTSTDVQYSNGNLTFSPNSSWSTTTFTRNNMVIPKDKKIYMEVHCDNQSGDYHMFGVSAILAIPEAAQSGSTGTVMIYNGSTRINGTRTDNVVTNPSQGDIVGIAIDGSNNKVWFAINNTWQLSGDPSNGTNELGTVTTNSTVGTDITFAFNQNSASILTANFGQDSTFSGQKTAGGNSDANGFGDFYYAPPTGFLCLASPNLSISDDIDPAQTDDDYPSKQFGVVTYTGNGGASQSISNLGFTPDLCWLKQRSASELYSNNLIDSTRGRSKTLYSSRADAEATSASDRDFGTFDSDGFTVLDDYNTNMNQSSITNVAWCWRAGGGVTSSNTDGSITTTVQSSTSGGFSISKYTSNGSGQTFGHGLGATPDWFIIKKIDNQARNWMSWHKDVSTTTTGYFRFNTDNAEENDTLWNNTAPTSSVISVQKDTTEVNSPSGDSYICYAWRGIEGFSKFGKYTGNGNADGPFVYTGFRPRLIFVKLRNSAGDWWIQDTARSTFNPLSKYIAWNRNDAEATGIDVDFLSNGFKIRTSSGDFNSSGATILYGAWGDVPTKYGNTF